MRHFRKRLKCTRENSFLFPSCLFFFLSFKPPPSLPLPLSLLMKAGDGVMTEAVSDKAPVPDQSSAKLLPALSLLSDERKRTREGVKKKCSNEAGMLGVPFLLFDFFFFCLSTFNSAHIRIIIYRKKTSPELGIPAQERLGPEFSERRRVTTA